MRLDNLDKNLLKYLQSDGRLSLRDLGKKLDVPHTTVYTRINKLVKNKVIHKFSAVMNPADVGLKVNMIVINKNDERSDDIAESLSEYAEVMKVFKAQDGKVFVKALCPIDGSQDSCLDSIKSRLDGYDYSIHPVDEVVKFDTRIHGGLIDQLK